jgi:hypothetical protein
MADFSIGFWLRGITPREQCSAADRATLKAGLRRFGLQQAGRVEGPDVALFPGGTPKPTAVGFQGVSHCENGQMQLEASEKGSRES